MGERSSENSEVAMKSDLSFSDGLKDIINSVGRVLEPDILAKRGCRIRVSDLFFSDGLRVQTLATIAAVRNLFIGKQTNPAARI